MVQLVHYPMMGKLGQTFDDCHKFHLSGMGVVVGPVMLVEAGTAVALCWTNSASPIWWLGVMLLACIWASTFFTQVPLHNQLACGFDPRIHRRLVRSNWVRTVAWTLRSVLALTASLK